MQTETRGLFARPISIQGAPDVLENFMSVEKVGPVEQIKTSIEISTVR
jgi:hypothetical protein